MNRERYPSGRSAVLGLIVALGTFASIGTASAQVPSTPQTGGGQSDPNTGTNPAGQAPQPTDLPPTSPGLPPSPAGEHPRETQQSPNNYGPNVAPSPSPATPAPSTLEKVANTVTSLIRPYGTLKPTIDVSVGSVESFGNPNASAPSAAANPALTQFRNQTRLSFQAAQSRMGFWVAEKSQARAHVEIDFVDFTKATPTLASNPRLRIAAVEYEPIEHFVITAGQDWDLYAPVNPFTTNLVGANFEAGNTGFMRQQVKFVYTMPETAELGFALGLPAQNAAFRDAGIELAQYPTFAVRAAALFGKSGKIGFSGIATRLRLGLGAKDERRAGSYSGNVFVDIGKADGFQLKGEGYVSRNLNNLGSLSLGFGNAAHDMDEVGGFLSGRQQLAEQHAVYVTVGAAGVLNAKDVVPDYSITAGAAGAAATRALTATGPGMKFNMSAKLGYEYRPYKPIAIIVEPTMFRSRHVLQKADWGQFGDPLRNAFGFETAMMYFF